MELKQYDFIKFSSGIGIAGLRIGYAVTNSDRLSKWEEIREIGRASCRERV